MTKADADMTADDGGDPQVTFKVKTSGDRNHTLTMAESATVEELKETLAGDEYEKIPAEHQRLIYSGRVMKNKDPLSAYNIKAGNTVHLVRSAASNRAAATADVASSAAANAAPAVPANMAAGTSASNLMEGLTGARFAGRASLPNADIFGPDGGMAPPPNEEQLADMLSNPAIAAGMNEALANPNMVDYMIQQNPILRSVPNAREVLQSPAFRRMLTDPEALRMASRMRQAMSGMGGGAAAAAFPAPGATDSTPEDAAASASPSLPAGAIPPAPQANPFAALFPSQLSQGAAGGQAPFSGANPFGMSPELVQQLVQALGEAGGLGGAGGMFGAPAPVTAPAPADNRPPEERYAEQLRQLNDMGFFDFDTNVTALRRSGGSVQGAIEHLLNN